METLLDSLRRRRPCDGHSRQRPSAGQPLTLPDACLTERYLRSIHAEIQAHAEPDAVILARFFEIWMRELRRVVNPGREAARVPERLLAVARYIESNLAQPMTLAALAGRANLSVSQFSVEFKRHFATSPIDYVLSQRLKQATYFLCDYNLSISEVARRVGFKDPFHFSRQFKKHHGISPLLYRERPSASP